MLTGKRALIVEPEFLIALDIQRILEGAGLSQTAFARSLGEAVRLQPRLPEFELMILDYSPAVPEGQALLAEALARGVDVIITTSAGLSHQDVPNLPSVPILRKPFSDADLLEACRAALHQP